MTVFVKDVRCRIYVYPIPANYLITVRNNNNKNLGTVIIYAVSGKLVNQKLTGNAQMIIDVQHFYPGVYYIRSDQFSAAIKFVKE